MFVQYGIPTPKYVCDPQSWDEVFPVLGDLVVERPDDF